jgi:tetratricopeptide (TPR) repeat protein
MRIPVLHGRAPRPWRTHSAALEINSETLASLHRWNVALNNLTMMYQALGHFEEAFKAYDRALAIHEPALGPEQRYLAIVWSCCPKTRCRLGDAIGACGRKDN